MFKLPHDCTFSHASKVMLKFFKLGFNRTRIENSQMFKLNLEKAEEPDQIANIHWIIEKAKEFQKNIYFCFIDYTDVFDCVDHNKLRKILEETGIPENYSPLLPSSRDSSPPLHFLP